MSHPSLFERQLLADKIEPAPDLYRVVFEDPRDPEGTARIYCPAPKFVAFLMAGGVASPLEAHVDDNDRLQAWLDAGNDPSTFSWDKIGGARHPSAAPIAPMTHEQAIEYLVMKDLPRRVWDDAKSNRPHFKIVRRSQVPTDRTYRNAWRFAA